MWLMLKQGRGSWLAGLQVECGLCGLSVPVTGVAGTEEGLQRRGHAGARMEDWHLVVVVGEAGQLLAQGVGVS